MRTTWNPYVIGAFEAVFRPWMGRRIAARYVRGSLDAVPRNCRVILAANHVSWWDGFLLRELHRKAESDRPLFTLMKSEQVARYPFFARMGVVGLHDDAASVMHALRLLNAAPSPYWLSYFPQGRIWPSWKRPLGFRRGLEVFARELAPCLVVPIALHLEPLTEPAPSAFVGIGDPQRVEPGGSIEITTVQRAVERILDDLVGVLAAHGEEAGAAWTST